MTVGPSTPQRILAVMEPEGPQIALESALALAEQHGAALEIISCVEAPHDLSILSRLSGEAPEHLMAKAAERVGNAVRAQLSEVAGGNRLNATVAVGKAYVEIIRHVATANCDFVIKKAEPLSGVGRFLFASTDQHLLRKCPCPVWLQTTQSPSRPKRVVAAVDLDLSDAAEPDTLEGLNRRVVDVACHIASSDGAEVTVLHAWEAVGEGLGWAFSTGEDSRVSMDAYVDEVLTARRQAMHRFLARVREEGPPKPDLTPRLVRGATEWVLHEQSRDVSADVVVMGTVARTGLNGIFIGNTAENIINSLECAVLAVKPDGFVSPLTLD